MAVTFSDLMVEATFLPTSNYSSTRYQVSFNLQGDTSYDIYGLDANGNRTNVLILYGSRYSGSIWVGSSSSSNTSRRSPLTLYVSGLNEEGAVEITSLEYMTAQDSNELRFLERTNNYLRDFALSSINTDPETLPGENYPQRIIGMAHVYPVGGVCPYNYRLTGDIFNRDNSDYHEPINHYFGTSATDSVNLADVLPDAISEEEFASGNYYIANLTRVVTDGAGNSISHSSDQEYELTPAQAARAILRVNSYDLENATAQLYVSPAQWRTSIGVEAYANAWGPFTAHITDSDGNVTTEEFEGSYHNLDGILDADRNGSVSVYVTTANGYQTETVEVRV